MPDSTLGHHLLPSGRLLRLRLPHRRDLRGALALCARLGCATSELELSRELRFDPRTRAVVVAGAWDGGQEMLVGLAATDLSAPGPELLLVDPAGPPELPTLLTRALADRVAAHAPRAA